jgi:hypothetical protein
VTVMIRAGKVGAGGGGCLLAAAGSRVWAASDVLVQSVSVWDLAVDPGLVASRSILRWHSNS